MTIAPMTLGSVVAIALLFLAVLLAVGILPFNAVAVGILLLLAAISRLT